MKPINIINKPFRIVLIFGISSILAFSLSIDGVYGVNAGGGLTLSGVGDWSGSGGIIDMAGNTSASITEIAIWNSDGGATDYLSFVDSSIGVKGAHLKMRLNSGIFTYSGNGVSNTGLVNSTNLYVIAKVGAPPDKGRNDTTKTANLITAESCRKAELTDISFHSSFNNNSLSNAIKPWTSDKNVFIIATRCTTTTRINFAKIRIAYPQLTTSGTYKNTFILTAVDGLP